MKKKGVYHHGDLRSALLEGVAQIIRERGVSNVSLREVARRIGVSHGAPAHHFASKQALLTAFATDGYARLATVALDSVVTSGARDARERLIAVGKAYVRFATSSPEYFEVMFRSDAVDINDPAFAAASDAAFSLLQKTVEAIEKEGHLGKHDPETLAIAAWSLVHGLAALTNGGRIDARTRSRKDPVEMAERVTKLFVGAALGTAKGRAR